MSVQVDNQRARRKRTPGRAPRLPNGFACRWGAAEGRNPSGL
ncbi:MAG: hypothetical protein AAFQ88_14410 [Pseudomonadota bacterium]